MRTSILPRRWNDWIGFLLVVIFVPSIFTFDIIVVVPAIHTTGRFLHMFTLVAAAFLTFNILGNWLASVVVDTSVKFDENKPAPDNWHYCEKCHRMVPPRAWHCKVCRCCILKRDHHCLFTACCIGHRNQRYFIVFVMYLFISSLYAFVYNSYYFWVLKATLYNNWFTVMKVLCPFMFLFSKMTLQNYYLLLYNINFLGLFYATALLIYHVPKLLRGSVCFEDKSEMYDEGIVRNLRSVLGNRMLMVWVTPFVRSELPSDGSNWCKLDVDAPRGNKKKN